MLQFIFNLLVLLKIGLHVLDMHLAYNLSHGNNMQFVFVQIISVPLF